MNIESLKIGDKITIRPSIRTIRQLNDEQQRQVCAAYETLGIPSDRLPHTEDIALIAEECGATEEEVWQFMLDARGRKVGAKVHKLPEIKGRVISRRAPLDPDHCELFEQTLGERMVANAENEVYMPLFIGWCDLLKERTRNQWAYDLIRYRKWKAQHDAGVMPPKKPVRAPRGDSVRRPVAEPTQAIIAIYDKDRLAFIGPSPSPATFEFLREIDDDECLELQWSYHERRVTGNVYRVERHELDVDQEVVL